MITVITTIKTNNKTFNFFKWIFQGCKEAAAEFKKNRDLSVNPCEDFYKYSCGGFLKRFKIPEDRSDVSQPTITGDKIRDQVGQELLPY